jgi:hypothetical protein
MAPTNKVHVIGCGVLALDLKALVESLNMDVSMEFLPGGLHGTPKELRRRLQERIDYASRRGGVDRIAIAYGICGMGAADLHARNVPLVIPRVNDCIALFLGSDQAYRDQFTQWPGTYYVSAGWVTENASPQDQECRPGPGPNDAEYESMVEQFGEDNADAIRYFMNSWTRNYQRAAFIDTGVGPQRQRFADMARRMAETFDWEYAELAGTHNLLEAMLTTRRTTDDVLFVPPHHVTAYDAVVKKLAAVPVWANDAFGEEHVQQIVVDEGEAIDEQVRTVKLGLGIDAGGTYTDAVIFDFEARRALAKAKALTTRWDFTIGINEALDQLPADQLKRVELASVSTTLATNAIVEGQGQKAGLLIMPPYGLFSPSDITHRPIDVLSGRLEISGEEIEPVDADRSGQSPVRWWRPSRSAPLPSPAMPATSTQPMSWRSRRSSRLRQACMSPVATACRTRPTIACVRKLRHLMRALFPRWNRCLSKSVHRWRPVASTPLRWSSRATAR